MITEDGLRAIPLLSDLESFELERLAEVMHEREVAKGKHIVQAEEEGSSINFLIDGSAKVTLESSDGKEIVLYSLEVGDFFGEIAMLTGEQRSANVVATSTCKLLVLGGEEFRNHVRENSGLAMALMTELARRLRAASSKIGDLALYDVYRRVARTLKSLAQPVEIDGELREFIQRRPTHQELANMVGTSREMVTRALKGLEEDGCIVVESKTIEVKKLPL